MIRPILISLLGILITWGCSPEKEATIPSPQNLQWGQSPQKTAQKMIQTGWVEKSQKEGQIFLSVPLNIKDKEKQNRIIDEAYEPLMATLFSQNKKLVIVKFFNRNRKRESIKFLSDFKKSYKVEEAVWKSAPLKIKTSTGNQILETTEIFTIENAFVVLIQTEITLSEKLKKSSSELTDLAQTEIEIRILSKKYNEGISQEALIQSIKKGLQ